VILGALIVSRSRCAPWRGLIARARGDHVRRVVLAVDGEHGTADRRQLDAEGVLGEHHRRHVGAIPVQPRDERAGTFEVGELAVDVRVLAAGDPAVDPAAEQRPVVERQLLLGGPELEPQHVPGELFLFEPGAHEGLRMPDRERCQVADAVGLGGGEAPADRSTPVVGRDGDAVDAAVIEQLGDVGREGVEGVGRRIGRAVAVAEPAQVGRDDPVAGVDERADLVPPHRRPVGKAVQEQHGGPCPHIDDVQRGPAQPDPGGLEFVRIALSGHRSPCLYSHRHLRSKPMCRSRTQPVVNRRTGPGIRQRNKPRNRHAVSARNAHDRLCHEPERADRDRPEQRRHLRTAGAATVGRPSAFGRRADGRVPSTALKRRCAAFAPRVTSAADSLASSANSGPPSGRPARRAAFAAGRQAKGLDP